MNTLEQTLAKREKLVETLNQYYQNEPVGLQYTKEDKYRWSFTVHNLCSQKRNLDILINQLLDEQLLAYFNGVDQDICTSTWDKKEACCLLKQRVELNTRKG